MKDLHLSLLGRSYTLACEPEDVSHVKRLHEDVASVADNHSHQLHNASDPRILLLTALEIADELSGCQRRINELEAEINTTRLSPSSTAQNEANKTVTDAFAEVTRQLNALAQQLENTLETDS